MLTQKTTRGVGAMLTANLLGRFAGLLAQMVAGWVLTDTDFGVFAIATTFANMAGLLRGGDIQTYHGSLPPAARRFRIGSVFWMSEVFYLVGVVPMLLAAPWIAEHFDAPELVPLLWLLGCTSLLMPVLFILKGRLNAELRFDITARASLLANLTQYLLLILLVAVLRSPIALGIPLLVANILQVAYLWRYATPPRHDFRFVRRLAIGVLQRLWWLLAIAAATSLWTNGDYLVAQFLVSVEVLGVYYFGYQLAVQPGRLFMTAVTNVLVPVVRRVIHDPERVRNVLRRFVGSGGFVIAVVNIGLLACIAPIEHLVWGGKWAAADLPVQMLAVGLVYTSVLGIVRSPFLAARRYREALVANVTTVLGVCGGAAAGSILGGTPNTLAGWTSGMMVFTSLLTIAWLASRLGAIGLPVVLHLIRCTIPVIVAGGTAAVIGHLCLDIGDGRVWSAIALIVAGGSYLVGVLVSAQMLPLDTRTEFLRLLPNRIQGRAIARYLLRVQTLPQDR